MKKLVLVLVLVALLTTLVACDNPKDVQVTFIPSNQYRYNGVRLGESFDGGKFYYLGCIQWQTLVLGRNLGNGEIIPLYAFSNNYAPEAVVKDGKQTIKIKASFNIAEGTCDFVVSTTN